MPAVSSASQNSLFHRAACAMLVAVYLLTTVGLPLAGAVAGVAPRCGCSLARQQERTCCCEAQPQSGKPPEVRACCRKKLNVAGAAAAEEPAGAGKTRSCCRSQTQVAAGATSAAEADLTAAAEQPVHAELRSCNCQLRPSGDIGMNAEPRLAGTRPQLTVLPMTGRLQLAVSRFSCVSIAPETPPPKV